MIQRDEYGSFAVYGLINNVFDGLRRQWFYLRGDTLMNRIGLKITLDILSAYYSQAIFSCPFLKGFCDIFSGKDVTNDTVRVS